MKLAILGGGGFRVPLVYEAVVTGATGLQVDEIALYDVDPARLRATTDLREAVTAADFVFSAVRVGGAKARTVDERVALGLGLLGQETIGPGGLAFALRTLPDALDIARTIAEAAPEAWTINFTNAAGIVTEAMRTVLKDRVVGICDTPIGLVRRVGRLLDVDLVTGERAASFDYVGLNHLGWLRSVTIDGRDRLPELLADDALLEEIEEARLIGKDWVRADGALPNEYLFYYLHTVDAIDRITGAATTRGEFLAKQQGDFYRAAHDAEAGSGAPSDGGSVPDTARTEGGACCSSRWTCGAPRFTSGRRPTWPSPATRSAERRTAGSMRGPRDAPSSQQPTVEQLLTRR